MIGHKGIAAVGVLLLVVATVIVACGAPQPQGFRAWLRQVREGGGDRGWHLLDGATQGAYGSQEQYLRDVVAAEWSALLIGPPTDAWDDDGFVHVQAELLSPPQSVPAFLFERGLVHGICDSHGRPIGLGVFEDRRPLHSPTFSGGGLTGSQEDCQSAFE